MSINWDYWLTWLFRLAFLYYLIRVAIYLRGLLLLGQDDKRARGVALDATIAKLRDIETKVEHAAKASAEAATAASSANEGVSKALQRLDPSKEDKK